MGWTWLKQLFFSSTEENNLDPDCDDRVIEEGLQSCQEDSDSKEIGIVTSLQNGVAEINKVWIVKDDIVSLKIGAIVTYCKPKNSESNVVSNVELVQNVIKRTNLENIISEGIITYVDEEKILINPGSLVIWRCDAEISFSPQPNDYTKLEFCNDILKVHPRECKVITDEVISWNGMHGFLKSNIKISQDICDNFYVPKVGDIVIGSAISCLGDGYQWRCLILSKFDKKNLGQHKRIEVKNIPTFILPFGTEKVIEVPVKNISLKSLEIKRVQIIPHLTNVSLLQNSIRQIEPGINVTYRILCCGRVLGRTVFTLEFKFKSFVFHRNVKFLTVEEGAEESYDQKNIPKGSVLLINQPFNQKPMFLKYTPKNYELPSYLLEISGKSVLESMFRIQEKLPELCKGITEQTYAIFFHTVLFLEELSRIHLMEQMETVAPLIKRGQYYVFSFEEETIYHNLSPGDMVLLSYPWEEDESESPALVKIWMRKDNEIFLNFKDVYNIIGNSGALFRMKFKSNRTTTVRTHHAIDFFLKRISAQWLFPDVSFVKIYDNISKFQINYFNKDLNEEQRDAVRNIVLSTNNCSSPYLLFGPPGTGKTVTLVEAVSQVIQHYPDSRILFAAPSNSAVDTFCELLISNGLLNNKKLLRLTSFTYSQQGQMPVSLVEYSAILSTNVTQEDSEIRYCDTDAVTQYKVLASTLSNLGILNCLEIRRGHFTHVFIDEAGQTTEPETLIPLAGIQPGNTRVVLAGDPKQLGPVILNPIAKEYGLQDSLMLRLMELPFYSRCLEAQNRSSISKVATMLLKNYRSLPCLVNLFSNLFYNNQLMAMLSEDSREAQLLSEIKKVKFFSSASSLVVVNVKGQEDTSNGEGHSFRNLMEATRVSLIVIELYKAGFTSTQIGVITPYSLQVKNISECFSTLQVEPPKIGTVEEFQGSERDIIVLSLVRTTLDECLLSFIGDAKRSNVALSRAKVMNIIVANEATLRRSNLWEKVLSRAAIVD